MQETAIRLDNDMILERQRVEVGGYTVTLDPAAYVTRIEILLSEWGERSTAILAEARKAEEAGDFDLAERKIAEEREYIAGLIEVILQAKPLPVDLADPARIMATLERVYAQCADAEPLARWIEDTKERLSCSLNPGWDKATILDRIPSVRRMYKLLVFFGRLAGGLMSPVELELIKNPPRREGEPANSPDPSASAPGPGSSLTSASATPPTRRKRR